MTEPSLTRPVRSRPVLTGFFFILLTVMLSVLPACASTEGLLVNNIIIDPAVALEMAQEQATVYKVERLNLLNYYGDFARLFLTGNAVAQDRQLASEHAIQTVDGSELLINPSSGIRYVAPGYMDIDYAFSYRSAGASDPERDDTLYFDRNADLPFMPRAQAEEEVMGKILFLFDQYTLNVRETFALDHRRLSAREQDWLDMELADPRMEERWETDRKVWSEADDCYYIVMEVSLDSIPLLEKNRDLDYLLIYGVTAEACYGAEGIRYLRISPLYSMNAPEQSGPIISSAAALECVRAKYASIITTKETTVKSLKLRYVALPNDATWKKYSLIPAWCAELQEKMLDASGREYYITSTIYFNAMTGKELL